MSRLPRTATLLVLACAGAAGILAASQFITLFELTPPGGEALAEIDAEDQHGYATLVLAAFSLILLVIALGARGEALGQIAAFAVAVCGVVALLIFLLGDLPDTNKVGTLDDPRQSFIDAKAEPQTGFWLELIGSLLLAVCGVALATLGPDHAAWNRAGPRRSGGSRREAGDGRGPRRAQQGARPDREEREAGGGGFQWPSRSRERR